MRTLTPWPHRASSSIARNAASAWPNWSQQAAASDRRRRPRRTGPARRGHRPGRGAAGRSGHFEENYLDLPAPVLIGVMKKHQRYFPVMKDGKMLQHFITVANADCSHPEVVRQGYEGRDPRPLRRCRLLLSATTRASRSIPSTPRLATLTFHAKLGSMLDKVERLKVLAPQIAQALGQSEADVEAVARAAALSKSDLVTNMVVEMTIAAGHHGRNLRRNGGEPEAVAVAIREQYLPRSAGDANPVTPAGLALSLADKLDSLVGLFAVGAIPTGSADPFGLRRAALGIVNNLLETGTDFDIRAGLEMAAALQPVDVAPPVLDETATFIARRLQGVLSDMGYSFDVVEAVLAVRGGNPVAARRAADALSTMVRAAAWGDAFTAYARTARITRALPERLPLNAAAYVEPVEQALHDASAQAEQALAAAAEPADLLAAQLGALQGPINAYFDKVLVNAEAPELRAARLALVQQVAALPAAVADLSKLQGF